MVNIFIHLFYYWPSIRTLEPMFKQLAGKQPLGNTSNLAPTVATSPTKASIFDKLDRVKVSSTSVVNPARKTSAIYAAEIGKYLDDDAIGRTSCPLKWWRVNRLHFPAVAEIARALLGVPATSIASERLFSKTGENVTKKRNSLKLAKAEKVIFLMQNLWIRYFGIY